MLHPIHTSVCPPYCWLYKKEKHDVDLALIASTYTSLLSFLGKKIKLEIYWQHIKCLIIWLESWTRFGDFFNSWNECCSSLIYITRNKYVQVEVVSDFFIWCTRLIITRNLLIVPVFQFTVSVFVLGTDFFNLVDSKCAYVWVA